MPPPTRRSIAASAERLRRGETSSITLVNEALAVIERHNRVTNAFTSINADMARTRARALDDDLDRGIDRGPLHGIPLSIKDLIDVAGEVTSAGSHVLDDRRATADAAIIAHLHSAGAVIIGRTNLHEFALGTTSEDSASGPIRHPADTTRIAGGSSGGSAVAVALGMGLASVGTDTGGSVRIPAALCGIVGLKPARGDVSTAGVVPLSATLDHVGPLATNVEDSACLWHVLSGRAPAGIAPAPPRTLRIKRLGGYFDHPIEPAVREAFTQALERLRDAGITVVAGTFPTSDRIGQTYADIVLPEAAAWHAPYLDARGDKYQPAVRARILAGRTVPAVAYLEALSYCHALSQAVDDLLDGCDALVLPTLPMTAPLLGTTELVIDPADPTHPMAMPTRTAMLKHTQVFNLTGHPAISLPIDTTGLPVGLQLVGAKHDTARLLAIAAGIEPHLRQR